MDAYYWAKEHLSQQRLSEPWHAERYARTLEFLEKYCSEANSFLDVGGPSPFREMVQAYWSSKTVQSDPPEYDCRFDALHDEKRYDVAIMTEVLEHLHDLPGVGPRDTWSGSGQIAALRVLARRAERIVLTTPNVCSLRTLVNVARSAQPRTYEPHVRELNRKQLLGVISAADLDVEILEERTVWGHHGLNEFEASLARTACSMLGGSPDRGDDFFCLLRSRVHG